MHKFSFLVDFGLFYGFLYPPSYNAKLRNIAIPRNINRIADDRLARQFRAKLAETGHLGFLTFLFFLSKKCSIQVH